MNDYEKACARSWCIDHALQANKGKKAPVTKIINDAALIHRFVADVLPADVIKLTEKK